MSAKSAGILTTTTTSLRNTDAKYVIRLCTKIAIRRHTGPKNTSNVISAGCNPRKHLNAICVASITEF